MDNKKEEKKEDNSFFAWIKVILTAIILAILIRTFIFSATLVIGESMNPTLVEKDRLISLKLPLFFKNPNRYDIVVIDAPDDKGKEYVKRVVGLPNDHVKITDGKVYINDKLIDEKYTSSTYTETDFQNEWKLDKDEFFVMGDNRLPGKSLDSRYFGPIKKKSIDGIIKFRYWPINRIKGGKI